MNNPRSIFLVGTRWFGVLGPCKLLIRELVRQGFDVYVFGQKDLHYQQFDSFQVRLVELNVRRSYYSFLFDILDIVKLRYYLGKARPLAVHSFNPKPSLLCYFSLIGRRGTRFFIGVTGLGNTFIKAKRLEPFIARIIGKAANRADHVFFQNPDDRDLFVNKLKTDLDKTRLFRSPGVDTDRFRMKAKFSTGGKLKVLLVARLIWQKGVDDFFAAYSKVLERGLTDYYDFSLVGEIDEQHPDKLMQSDVDAIADSGINWIPWSDRVEEIIAQNDLLLFMSKREGGPRAILEAAAVGLPTIGSNCIGVRELILDSETGFVVNSGDIDAILEKLEMYRNNRDMLAQHGRNARSQIAEIFSLENATRAQLEMYDCI